MSRGGGWGKRRKSAAKKSRAEKKSFVTQHNPTNSMSEMDRISFVTNAVRSFNDKVRGFKAVGSCITDSMLFVGVWNRLFTDKAVCVCTDLAAMGSSEREGMGQTVTLWHKGHDGNDPKYPDYRTNPRYYQEGATGYDGHVIVQTKTYLLDLTLGQINRRDMSKNHGSEHTEYYGGTLIAVPNTFTFRRDHCKAMNDYPENVVQALTEIKSVEMRQREHLEAGEDKSTAKIIRTWTQDLALLNPDSLAPEQVSVHMFEDIAPDMEYTLVAYALRPDIDFETELGVHRQYFGKDDDWNQIRKRHVKMILHIIKKGGFDPDGTLRIKEVRYGN